MKIDSPVLGQIDVSEDKIIEFPKGLPGFEQCTRFALLHEEGKGAGLHLLQGLDEPELLLSVTGPEQLGITYEFELSEEDAALIGLEKVEDVAVAVILRRDDTEGDTPSGIGMRANFMAPLVINTASRKGIQKVINRLGCAMALRELS